MSSHTIIVNSRNINLNDTTARNSGLVVLDKPIQVPEDYEMWIAIHDAQIPNTYYNVLNGISIPLQYTPSGAENQNRTVTGTNILTSTLTLNNTTGLFVGGTISGFSGTFGHITPVNFTDTYTITSISGNDVKVSPALVFKQPDTTSSIGTGYAVTALDSTNDLITLYSTAGLLVGDQIRFNFGSPFAGLDNTVFYYIVSIAGNNIQVSDTPGGSPIYLNGGTIAAGTTVSKNVYTGGTITARAQLLLNIKIPTLPDGNYTSLQLVTGINGKQLAFNDGFTNGTVTLGLSLTNSATTIPRFQLNLTAVAGTNTGVLGDWSIPNFTNATLGFVAQTIGSTAVTGAVIPYLQPSYYIVHSSLMTGAQVPGLSNKVVPLGKIPIRTVFGYVDKHFETTPFFLRLKERAIQSFDISLLDEYARPVSLQGADWSLTLTIEFHKKKEFLNSL